MFRQCVVIQRGRLTPAKYTRKSISQINIRAFQRNGKIFFVVIFKAVIMLAFHIGTLYNCCNIITSFPWQFPADHIIESLTPLLKGRRNVFIAFSVN
jgi:hypothetical protein